MLNDWPFSPITAVAGATLQQLTDDYSDEKKAITIACLAWHGTQRNMLAATAANDYSLAAG